MKKHEKHERKHHPHPTKHAHKKKPWLGIASIVVGLALVVLVFFNIKKSESEKKAKAPTTPRSVPVTASTARQGDVGVYIEALGIVTPLQTVNVTSRVQGQIVSVKYREGQMVLQGTPLIEIDPRPYEAALKQTQGQLAHDRAALKEARIDLQRYKEAYARNAIPKQQLDDQIQIVLQDSGTVKADEGNLENAQVNLIYCHITSPITGRMGLRLVDPGNMVQANSTTPLAVVAQLQPITVIFSVAEDYLPKIQEQLRQGNAMEVDAFDRNQKKRIAEGSFWALDNQIDTTTGTVKIRAVFPNDDGTLFPNQFVNARLQVDTQTGATLISSAAIQRNSQGAYVYVVKQDQTAEMRPIKAGTVNGNVTAVEGVDPGEVVVATGFDKIQEGMKVTVQNKQVASRNRRGTQ